MTSSYGTQNGTFSGGGLSYHMSEQVDQLLAERDIILRANRAQLQNHEARITALENAGPDSDARMDSLEARVGDLEDRMDIVEGDVEGLSGHVETMQEAITDIEGRLDIIEGDNDQEDADIADIFEELKNQGDDILEIGSGLTSVGEQVVTAQAAAEAAAVEAAAAAEAAAVADAAAVTAGATATAAGTAAATAGAAATAAGAVGAAAGVAAGLAAAEIAGMEAALGVAGLAAVGGLIGGLLAGSVFGDSGETSLQDKIAEMDTRADDLEMLIDEKLPIATYNTFISGYNTFVDAQEAKDVEQDGRLDDLEAAAGGDDFVVQGDYDTKMALLDAKDAEHDTGILARVLTTAYDTKMAALDATNTAQDTATGARVLTTTYNTKMTALDASITFLNTRSVIHDDDITDIEVTLGAHATDIAARVLTTTYNTKMSALDATNTAQDTAIAARVLTTTYNTKMTALDASDTAAASDITILYSRSSIHDDAIDEINTTIGGITSFNGVGYADWIKIISSPIVFHKCNFTTQTTTVANTNRHGFLMKDATEYPTFVCRTANVTTTTASSWRAYGGTFANTNAITYTTFNVTPLKDWLVASTGLNVRNLLAKNTSTIVTALKWYMTGICNMTIWSDNVLPGSPFGRFQITASTSQITSTSSSVTAQVVGSAGPTFTTTNSTLPANLYQLYLIPFTTPLFLLTDTVYIQVWYNETSAQGGANKLTETGNNSFFAVDVHIQPV